MPAVCLLLCSLPPALSPSLSCCACSISVCLCLCRCPLLLFALSFFGWVCEEMGKSVQLCVGSNALFAILLQPANTLPTLTIWQRSTALKLRLKCLINIQYARITHSIACSANQCACLLSLSLSISFPPLLLSRS